MNDETRQNPYAPPGARVSDYKDASGVIQLAGRGTRFGAAIIDTLVFFSTALPVLIAAGFDTAVLMDGSTYQALAGLATIGLLIGILVVTTGLVHRNGQTIGKWLVDIKVVRSDGSRATLARIFWLRNFVNWIPSAIPLIGSFYGLIDSLFIFGARRRCIHDLIADTVVVDT